MKREHITVGSQVGSHRQPTQRDSEPTEVFDNRYPPAIQLLCPTQADRQGLVRIEELHRGTFVVT